MVPPVTIGRPSLIPRRRVDHPAAAAHRGSIPGPYVYDATTARRIPAVARAFQLYGGMTKQMPIDAYRSGQPLPRPRCSTRPDPNRGRGPGSCRSSVEDYLLTATPSRMVTSRGADGWPLAVQWLPASWVYIVRGSPAESVNRAVLPISGQKLPPTT